MICDLLLGGICGSLACEGSADNSSFRIKLKNPLLPTITGTVVLPIHLTVRFQGNGEDHIGPFLKAAFISSAVQRTTNLNAKLFRMRIPTNIRRHRVWIEPQTCAGVGTTNPAIHMQLFFTAADIVVAILNELPNRYKEFWAMHLSHLGFENGPKPGAEGATTLQMLITELTPPSQIFYMLRRRISSTR